MPVFGRSEWSFWVCWKHFFFLVWGDRNRICLVGVLESMKLWNCFIMYLLLIKHIVQELYRFDENAGGRFVVDLVFSLKKNDRYIIQWLKTEKIVLPLPQHGLDFLHNKCINLLPMRSWFLFFSTKEYHQTGAKRILRGKCFSHSELRQIEFPAVIGSWDWSCFKNSKRRVVKMQ